MIIRESTVKLPNGLEARPVAMFVQIASEYSSEIMIEADGKKVNAKSIMGMMSLSLAPGEKVTISAQGPDEVEAATALDDFLGNKEQ